MTNRTPWTDPENIGLLALYFTMLDAAIPGHAYSKAGMLRIAQGTDEATPFTAEFAGELSDRSRPSIEFKLMNATAAHADIKPDAVTMDCFGYRAMPNYQATLRTAMEAELERRCDEHNTDADLISFDREQTQ
jgi:hypothetical protein